MRIYRVNEPLKMEPNMCEPTQQPAMQGNPHLHVSPINHVVSMHNKTRWRQTMTPITDALREKVEGRRANTQEDAHNTNIVVSIRSSLPSSRKEEVIWVSAALEAILLGSE